MEKNNGKIIAVVALVVAVVALSVGFAAFADQLTIDGNATLQATNDFDEKVQYVSTSPKCYATGDTNKTSVIITGYSTGTASNDTWSGISVPLSMTQKSVTCEAQVENKSSYVAYLKGIATTSGLTCASKGTGDSAATNVSTVCGTNNANVKATVIIGDSTSSTDKIEIQNAAANNTSTAGSIAMNGTTNVFVVIEYLGTTAPDGDILITLPTITHNYSTAQ